MTHDVIRHLLDDYVTGDLTEDARAPVADHIAGCAACSAEVESLLIHAPEDSGWTSSDRRASLACDHEPL